MVPNPTPVSETSVLVVEDEPMLLMVASETLRDAGFTVWEAGDGASAMVILQAHPEIDVLLTDIKMPGMTGYQLAEAGTSLRPSLKVVLMTGYTQDPVPKKMQEAGVRVLHKPFDIDRLPVVVTEVLQSVK